MSAWSLQPWQLHFAATKVVKLSTKRGGQVIIALSICWCSEEKHHCDWFAVVGVCLIPTGAPPGASQTPWPSVWALRCQMCGPVSPRRMSEDCAAAAQLGHTQIHTWSQKIRTSSLSRKRFGLAAVPVRAHSYHTYYTHITQNSLC